MSPVVLQHVSRFCAFLGAAARSHRNVIVIACVMLVTCVGAASPSIAFPVHAAESGIDYATYVGASNVDSGDSLAVDAEGNVYITGYTISDDFPVKPASPGGQIVQDTLGGSFDAYVAKFDAEGSLVYATYLGGDGADQGWGIAVDGLGRAIVVGSTQSPNFPTRDAFQQSLAGTTDAFVARLTVDGQLDYSSYLGGHPSPDGTGGKDAALGVVVDASGSAYIVGNTSSPDFPTRSRFHDYSDAQAFLTKLNAEGDIEYSTFLGGPGAESGLAITMGADGSVYVAGHTRSASFPTTPRAYQRSLKGKMDGFVVKLRADEWRIDYATYLGGDEDATDDGDQIQTIAVDTDGFVYVAGDTGSESFPLVSAAQPTYGGWHVDAFVAKLTPALDDLVFSTYLGGERSDTASGIAVDAKGRALVVGYTEGRGFPLHQPIRDTLGGLSEGFLTVLSDKGAIDSSTFVGGNHNDQFRDIFLIEDGVLWAIGHSESPDYPVTADSFQSTMQGVADAVLARIRPPTSLPKLELELDPWLLAPSGPQPSTAQVTATATNALGEPLPGHSIVFGLNPEGLGTLVPDSGVTDADGQMRVTYTAPTEAQLAGLDRVTIIATDQDTSESAFDDIRFTGYELSVSSSRETIDLFDQFEDKAEITAKMTDARDQPVPGDLIRFRLEPEGLGTLSSTESHTDAAGKAMVVYTAPSVADLKDHDRIRVIAENVTHPKVSSVTIRFSGLRVSFSSPSDGDDYLDYEKLTKVELFFNQSLNPATVNASTVQLSTLWHGDLGARARFGPEENQITVDLTTPLPDVGLRVLVRLESGADGVRSVLGAPLLSPHELRFEIMPRLDPKVIVSQVVDQPRDPEWGVLTLLPKPYVVRVEAGISPDSELEEHDVEVKLAGSDEIHYQTMDHTFHPGMWQPQVPSAVVGKGNSANFVIRQKRYTPGEMALRAELRYKEAPQKLFEAELTGVNMNVFRDEMDFGSGILSVEVSSDYIPRNMWNGVCTLPCMSSMVTELKDTFWPGRTLALRQGYAHLRCDLMDQGTMGQCDESRPWTHMEAITRHVGRTGWLTKFSRGFNQIVVLVPTGWFDTLIGHPDLAANPSKYHRMLTTRVWSTARFESGPDADAAWPIPIVEAGAPMASLMHALGDVHGLTHSTALMDDLDGYDLHKDRRISTDDGKWTGAYVSVMNARVGVAPSWLTNANWGRLLQLFTNNTCFVPPCPRGSAVDESGRLHQGDVETLPLLVVSGVIAVEGGMTYGHIDPVLRTEGTPTLDVGGAGDYAIELIDGSGSTVGRYAFAPSFGTVTRGVLANYLATVPDDPSIESVVLTHDGTRLLSRDRSASAPALTIRSPGSGAVVQGPTNVTWSGDDADGDDLTYHLHYSGDGGYRWVPLVVDSSDTQATLDLTKLPNGPESRLRLIASDGFHTAETTVSFASDTPLRPLAMYPADGANDVSVMTSVGVTLRDPLDTASVQSSSLSLRDDSGNQVAGTVSLDPNGTEVLFRSDEPLRFATTYHARLSSAVRTPDDRSLSAALSWTFTTRGVVAVHLPVALKRSGFQNPAAPTATQVALPSSTVVRSATPSKTPLPMATNSPVATRTPLRTSTPVPTPNATHTTSPRETSTPTASPRPPQPTPTASPTTPTGAVSLERVFTTSPDGIWRTAFVPLDELVLWIRVQNHGPDPVDIAAALEVRAPDGSLMDNLSWSGTIALKPDEPNWALQTQLPTGMPVGQWSLTGRVTHGGQTQTKESVFYVAHDPEVADDFSSSASGWPTASADPAAYEAGYVDGVYRMLVKVADRSAWSTPRERLDGYVVESSVGLARVKPGEAGLMFGLSSDELEYYMFTIDHLGRYRLYRRSPADWVMLRDWTTSPALFGAGSWNHLMAVHRGSNIGLYANGQHLADVSDGALVGGAFGVIALSASEPDVEAQFDNYRAYSVIELDVPPADRSPRHLER